MLVAVRSIPVQGRFRPEAAANARAFLERLPFVTDIRTAADMPGSTNAVMFEVGRTTFSLLRADLGVEGKVGLLNWTLVVESMATSFPTVRILVLTDEMMPGSEWIVSDPFQMSIAQEGIIAAVPLDQWQRSDLDGQVGIYDEFLYASVHWISGAMFEEHDVSLNPYGRSGYIPNLMAERRDREEMEREHYEEGMMDIPEEFESKRSRS